MNSLRIEMKFGRLAVPNPIAFTIRRGKNNFDLFMLNHLFRVWIENQLR